MQRSQWAQLTSQVPLIETLALIWQRVQSDN